MHMNIQCTLFLTKKISFACFFCKGIQIVLETMSTLLEKCWLSLLSQLESRCQKYPRFYFLSTEDVLHIVCNGEYHGLVPVLLMQMHALLT